MWTNFEKKDSLRLKEPAMVIAVSTSIPQYRALYSQARELAEYMLRKMPFERIATIRSSAFPPEVLVRAEGVSTLPECGFYLHRGKRDVVLLGGDTSPMEGQYEFAQLVLGYAGELGVKEVYSIGARWTENPLSPEADPQPCGFATDAEGVGRLEKEGVKILRDEPAPFFASMVVALAKERGMRGYKLSVDHGEPSPHARSVSKMLGVLSKLVGFEVEVEELKAQAGPPVQPKPDRGIYH